jgi:leucine carboxyl methyltransferase
VAATKRSRTAQGVAAERAVLADMGVVADPFAQDMLTPSMSAVLRVLRSWPMDGLRARSVTLASLAARVLWYDATVAKALDAGIPQVAVVGAVERGGWAVNEEMSLREAARTLVPRESGLPVDAVNEHKTLVAAVRS